MQKYVPYAGLIDSSRIVTVEEEWLYRAPAFFQRISLSLDVNLRAEIRSLVGQISSRQVVAGRGSNAAPVLHRAAQDCYERIGSSDDLFSGSPSGVAVSVVDAPRRKQVGGKAQRFDIRDLIYHWLSNLHFWGWLRHEVRSVQKAKKRFFRLYAATPETALACYLASTEEERPDMMNFFERHERYDKYFFDDTTMALNTWETELHISFYQLADRNLDFLKRRAIPQRSYEAFPGSQTKVITKASISFRFYGD